MTESFERLKKQKDEIVLREHQRIQKEAYERGVAAGRRMEREKVRDFVEQLLSDAASRRSILNSLTTEEGEKP